ncbi:MAG: cytochrome c biogenesis protein CcsA [Anaerolineae bacterium]|nr:cytochrome c biogenesis protein CcsA [Anaerolineae bacterium]
MNLTKRFTPSHLETAAPAVTVSGTPRLLRGLTGLAVAGFLLGLYVALFYAGTDAAQGNVQRIFYIHLSAFMGATVGYVIAFIGGVAYLRTRQPRWDTMALGGVEVGIALSVITLVTGMVWARPMWNTWWTWDPRLTSAAIMALTYAAYLMLRSGIENPEQRRKLASVYAILAITTVVFTFMITRVRSDTIHPTVIGPSASNGQGSFAMTPNMGAALGINMAVWTLLITPALIWWRVRLENVFIRVNQMRQQLLES